MSLVPNGCAVFTTQCQSQLLGFHPQLLGPINGWVPLTNHLGQCQSPWAGLGKYHDIFKNIKKVIYISRYKWYISDIYHDIYHAAQKALGGALVRVRTVGYTAHAPFPWVGWHRPPNETGLVRRSPVGLVESQVWTVGTENGRESWNATCSERKGRTGHQNMEKCAQSPRCNVTAQEYWELLPTAFILRIATDRI